MKVFKKVTSIMVIIILIMTLKVYAGTTEVKLTPPSANVKVGDTVTITLSAVRGNGIEGFDAVLTYDKTKLKLTNESQIALEGFTSLSGTDESTGEFKLSLMYVGSGTGPTEANLAELKFNVLDGAKVDDILNVKLAKIQLIDSEENGAKLDDTVAKLTVVKDEGTQNPGGNTQNPGGNTQNPGGNTQNPGGNTQNPGGNTQNPGGNTQNPGGNTQNPSGNTNVSGDYPYAGTKSSVFIIAFAVIIVSVAIYMRINKYRDIR